MKVRNDKSREIIADMFARQNEALKSGKVYSNAEVADCAARAILDARSLAEEGRQEAFLKAGQGFQLFTTELEESGTLLSLPQAFSKCQDSVKVWICKNIDFTHEHVLDFVLDLDIVHFQMDFASDGGMEAYVVFRWQRLNSGFVLHFIEKGE